jgi:hypothetical protein
MSKMACHCGNVISDVHYPSPTEGWLFREQDKESHYDAVCRDIASFFVAVHTGKREEWIRQFFPEPYPTDIGDESLIHDIISTHEIRIRLSVCECSKCGRLFVQQNNGVNVYVGFAPIESGYKGVLRSQPENTQHE